MSMLSLCALLICSIYSSSLRGARDQRAEDSKLDSIEDRLEAIDSQLTDLEDRKRRRPTKDLKIDSTRQVSEGLIALRAEAVESADFEELNDKIVALTKRLEVLQNEKDIDSLSNEELIIFMIRMRESADGALLCLTKGHLSEARLLADEVVAEFASFISFPDRFIQERNSIIRNCKLVNSALSHMRTSGTALIDVPDDSLGNSETTNSTGPARFQILESLLKKATEELRASQLHQLRQINLFIKSSKVELAKLAEPSVENIQKARIIIENLKEHCRRAHKLNRDDYKVRETLIEGITLIRQYTFIVK